MASPSKAKESKPKRAPAPSEWRFVEDAEFQDAFKSQQEQQPPRKAQRDSFIGRAFVLLFILIVGVYVVDLEEISIIGERTKDRAKKVVPFWQTTEEIMERFNADGSEYQQHMLADEAAGLNPQGPGHHEKESAQQSSPKEEDSADPPEVEAEEEAGEEAEAEPEPEEEPEAEPEPEPEPLPPKQVPLGPGSKPKKQAAMVPEYTPVAERTEEPAEEEPEEEEETPAGGGKRSSSGEKLVGSLQTTGQWPPAHCKGLLPVPSGPKLAKGSLSRAVGGSRRHLQSEAPTLLLVNKKPPDDVLMNQVYDYIMDYYGSNETCLPRSLAGQSKKCSGSGGGNSCRGMDRDTCRPTREAWEEGKPPLHPWPTLWKSKKGTEALGSWGSCAFVATGEQVLTGQFGKDIDAHDTVVRYNTPIKGFEKNVGKKCSLLWTKSKYSTTCKPTKGYILSGNPAYGKDAFIYQVQNSKLRIFRDQVYRIWFKARNIPEGKAAAGFARAVGLVKSGLCTSVDLYGFHTAAGKGGGKYFDKKAVVTRGHTIDWDGWLLKAMMDLGYLCVYGE